MWQEVDTDLEPAGGGQFRSTAGSVQVRIAGQADDAALTTVELGEGAVVSWSLGTASTPAASPPAEEPSAAGGQPSSGPGRGQAAGTEWPGGPGSAGPVRPARGVAPTVREATAVFEDALPGVDVELTSLPNGVKEDLVLADSQAPTVFTFR